MAVKLSKGEKISLQKQNGVQLTSFCVGCNWGAIPRETSSFFGLIKRQKMENVDLDLSCIMVNQAGAMVDHIYSPLYRGSFLARYSMPLGKLDSNDRAMHHSGDDLEGDKDGDDGLDNEIITVDLTCVSPAITQIFFFLNNCGKEDFSQIPYASIRMYEGTPQKVKTLFAEYNVPAMPQYAGMTALVMGKLFREESGWQFAALGDAYPDDNICVTILRILRDYAK